MSSFEDNQIYWHTSAHILAQAVKRLYPETKLSIGPAIKNGFYYDFDPIKPFNDEDLQHIEKEMKNIIKESLDINKSEMTKEKALKFFEKKEEVYKMEILENISDTEVSFYTQGEFCDLCRGPHLSNTNEVKAFKLLSATGAYFRGDEKNKMLTRIYGISFDTKEKLDEFLKKREEAQKWDHNKIGRELELFTTVDSIGQGLPILLPNGAKVIQLLQRFVEDEEEKRGYQITKTPFMSKNDIFKISGHWDHYKENMFLIDDGKIDNGKLVMRPMTCPFQFQVFLNKTRSYKDLPMRLSETSYSFRKESSGEMHGLIRLRQFTMSDAHIICKSEELESEFGNCLELARFCLKTLGLIEEVYYRFSKWDPNDKEKYMGTNEEWESAEKKMKSILEKYNIEHTEGVGEAAFYGPKLDIQIKNVYGKEDTLITIQIDFQSAQKFKMEYTDKDGKRQTPYVIHRTSIGCYERTLALLIEKYHGLFPLWLSPKQIAILPISEKNKDYANALLTKLLSSGITRSFIDNSHEKINYKIRKYNIEKVPCIVIIGDKEENENTVSLRRNNETKTLPFDEFLFKIKEEIKNKNINYI